MLSDPSGRYATVQDLASFIHIQLDAHERPSPGIDTLTVLFRAMYAASMATEEGRRITFELIWIDPDNSDPHPPERLVADRPRVVPLAARIPLTARALVKAAPATDPRTSSFAVYSSNEAPSLFIWGMVDQGNHHHDFMRFNSDSGSERPGLFQASALGIGHLGVRLTYEFIAELRIDRLSGPGLDPLRAGPVFDALQPGLEAHIQSVRTQVTPEVYQLRDHWDESLAGQWMGTLARLLLRIQGMAHGGAVLMTPDTSKRGLDVKYQIAYPRLPEALLRRGLHTIAETDASDTIWETVEADEDLLDVSDYLHESVERSEKEDAESEIDASVWFIACLSRVDGLILMDPDLSVRGFGTIITVEDAPSIVYGAGDDLGDRDRQIERPYDEFGTRHRSMMRYCYSYPGSVGFVISQDGDVRVMTKVEDDLVVWDGVRLLRAVSDLDSESESESEIS